jgi:hypothetical protein
VLLFLFCCLHDKLLGVGNEVDCDDLFTSLPTSRSGNKILKLKIEPDIKGVLRTNINALGFA